MEQLNLFKIIFPIYSITRTYKKIWVDINVTYIETDSGTYILDNKNVQGDTLGKRRLRIKNDVYKLYKPRKVIYNISQLLHSTDSVFIDTTGVVFKYKKTEMVPLKYHKVESITEAKDGECILEIPKLNYSYKTTCRYAYGVKFIGLLHTKYGYIPYEFCEEKKDDARRKI
jgi:hypothetical protein